MWGHISGCHVGYGRFDSHADLTDTEQMDMIIERQPLYTFCERARGIGPLFLHVVGMLDSGDTLTIVRCDRISGDEETAKMMIMKLFTDGVTVESLTDQGTVEQYRAELNSLEDNWDDLI